MANKPKVYIVDDDPAVRQSTRVLLEVVGLETAEYGTAQAFLDAYNPEQRGCLVLDVRMPGMSGMELQQRLSEQGIDIPVIIITGHGEVAMAVQAIKCGAVDFFTKPFSPQELLQRVQQAIAEDEKKCQERAWKREIHARLDGLTARQREVMEAVLTGKNNRTIADDLGVTTKAIEAHRKKLMAKMEASSMAELARFAMACDLL